MNTEQIVFRLVSEQMNVDESEITRKTSFVNDLNADSLDTIEIITELENEFDIQIDDEDAEDLTTLGKVIDHVEELLNR